MAKVEKTSQRLVGRSVEQFTHRASERFASEVEKIVYKVMTNPGLESTISNAIQKGLVTLVVRYWLWIGAGLVGFLLLHTAVVALVLVVILKT